MDDTRTVGALWAWMGKEDGSLADYEVLHNSGGRERRRIFDQYIREGSPGNPPADGVTGHDALPWITVSGWYLQTQQWIGLSVLERSDRRDHSGRRVYPTRFYLFPYDQLARHDCTFRGLYEAVQELELPPAAHDNTVPVQLPSDPRESCRLGLELIAKRLRNTAVSEDPTRRFTAAALWAGAVAAAVLESPSVIITEAGQLSQQERLSVLDAVAAFLPYGLRGELAVGTRVDDLRRPRTRLAFGASHTPGTRPVPLGVLPDRTAAPEPSEHREYGELLPQLIERYGPTVVMDGLARQRDPLRFADARQILDGLHALDIVHITIEAIRNGTDTPELIATALGERRIGEPVTPGWWEIFERALYWGGPELSRELTDLWSDPVAAPAVTELVAGRMLETSGNLPEADAGEQRRAMWAFTVNAGRGTQVLTELVRRYDAAPPAAGTGRFEALHCVEAIGPDEVFRAGTPAVDLLSTTRSFTSALLHAAAHEERTLTAWLEKLDTAGPDRAGWFQAWTWLLLNPARSRVALPPDEAPVARLVLSAAARTGAPGLVARAVRSLWPTLVATARAEGGTATPVRSAEGTRPLGVPDVPTVGGLLPRAELWRDCQARADALRHLTGGTPAGPTPDVSSRMAYEETIRSFHDDPALRHELARLVPALTKAVLRAVPDRSESEGILSALRASPEGGTAAARLIAEVDEAAARREREARERERAAAARAAAERQRQEREKREREQAAAQRAAAAQAAAERQRQAREKRERERMARELERAARAERERAAQVAKWAAEERAAAEQTWERQPAPPDWTRHSNVPDQPAGDEHTFAMANPELPAGDRQSADPYADAHADPHAADAHAAGPHHPGRPSAIETPQWPRARQETELSRLEDITRKARTPLDEVVGVWAPLAVSPPWEQAFLIVGWWWEHTPDDERGPVLDRLERALSHTGLTSRETASDLVTRLRVLIVTGHGRLTNGDGWQPGPFSRQERQRKKKQKQLWVMRVHRWRSQVNPAHGQPGRNPKDHGRADS